MISYPVNGKLYPAPPDIIVAINWTFEVCSALCLRGTQFHFSPRPNNCMLSGVKFPSGGDDRNICANRWDRLRQNRRQGGALSENGLSQFFGGRQVKLGNLDLNSRSIDELWTLHEEVSAVLSKKILAEKHGLEERLARLNRAMSEKATITRPASKTSQRRALRRKYPPVLPKYQNPSNPSETWAGRGKQPRWLVAQIKAGKKISDFLISRERQSASKHRSA
jgi:DNA-binding protein H-NS